MSPTAQDLFRQAVDECNRKDFIKAIDFFSKALDIDNDNAEIKYNRAKAYFRLKKIEEALADFDWLVKQYPNNGYYLSERAVALHLAGKNDAALADLNKAAELEPTKPFRYSSRAYIKERMGDLKGAIKDYEKCIALDPEDAIAHNNKGLIEEKLGYLDRSKQSFKRADDLDQKPVKNADTESNATVSSPAEPFTESEIEEDSISFNDYLSTVKNVVLNKSEREKFKRFVRNFFKRASE